MPHYFFDCDDHGVFYGDRHGIEVADRHEAVDQGACLARTIMSETGDSLGSRAVTVIVRSEDGTVIYTAHCSFHGLQVPDRG